jgi:hypothetical protein
VGNQFGPVAFFGILAALSARMKNFEFPNQFRALYDRAVALYAQGKRSADAMLSADDKAFLAANGISPQHIFDYAEDHNGYDGEPGPEHALSIELVRRDAMCSRESRRLPRSMNRDFRPRPTRPKALRGCPASFRRPAPSCAVNCRRR